LFDLEDLGPQQLAGFAEPQHAWRVSPIPRPPFMAPTLSEHGPDLSFGTDRFVKRKILG
jgi:hypothetical protein